MTTLYKIFLPLFVFFIHANAQWVSTDGPYGANVMALFVDGTNLYAGTNNGVYLSTDSGGHWTAAGMEGYPVNTFASVDSHLFVSSSQGGVPFVSGVFRSTNSGRSWEECLHKSRYLVKTLAVKDTLLFAGCIESYSYDGLFLSQDRGSTWRRIDTGMVGFDVYALAINENNIIAYDDIRGVLRSTDNGVSWVAANTGLPNARVSCFVFNKTHIFAGIPLGYSGESYGIFVSTNSGTSWDSVNTGLTNRFVHALALSPGEAGRVNLFAGTEGGVFLSTNNGIRWSDVGLTDIPIQSLAISDTNLYAGTDSGVWRRPLSEMIPTTDSLQVPVAGGTFIAGTTPVTISSFNIDKYEVTYELWTEVRDWGLAHGYTDLRAGENGINPVGTNNPVTMIGWHNAVKWCNARSEKGGLTSVYYTRSTQDTVYRTGEIGITNDAVKWSANGYRLPTECEWEFAAKGGTQAHVPPYTYIGSNTIEDVAWYDGNSGNTTHSVGLKSANELGIYDMSGNASEYCWDWYSSTYPSGTADPKGPSTGVYRMSRGGEFVHEAAYCLVMERYDFDYWPNYGIALGFRCVQDSQVGTAVKDETRIPHVFALKQNYPNPFNPSTTIRYTLPYSANVKLFVYDLLGREIATLVNEDQSAGWKEVEWNASQLPTGIYFYTLTAGSYRETRKMIMVK